MPAKNNDSKNNPLDPKVFDVSKPGKTPPSDSGKPIIVTSRPMVKDPMTVEKPEEISDLESDQPKKQPSATRTGITINPLDGAQAKDSEKPADAPGQASPEEQKPDKPKPPAGETPPEEKPEITKTEDEQQDSDETSDKSPKDTKPVESATGSGFAGAVAEEAKEQAGQKDGVAGPAEPQLTPEELARQQEIEKLINERTYNVPIGEPHKSKNLRHFMIFILILILLVAIGFELALDAGIIESDVPPAVDLIKN